MLTQAASEEPAPCMRHDGSRGAHWGPALWVQARLAEVLKLPANKQRISRDGVGIMRDEETLAFYNVGPETMLSLGVRERGRRK